MTAWLAAEGMPTGPAFADDATAEPMPAEPVPAGPTTDDEPPATEDPRRRRWLLLLLFLLFGLLAVLLAIAIWYLLFRQPINPIPVLPETQIPGYSTSIYGASRPWGVAVTSSGDRIYVTQTEGDRVVRIFDAGGNPVGTMEPPATTGTEHVPMYLAIDPLTSEVYVTDRPTASIYVYDRDGIFQHQYAPAEAIAGWQPVGIAFDTAGLLYVTDFGGASPTVQVFDRSGVLVRTLGETNGLAFPNGLAVDAAGNVYVADGNNGRLLVFGTDGAVVAQVGQGAGKGKLGLPRGVAIDGHGRVFVGDSSGQSVSVFGTVKDGDGRLEFFGQFGSQGIADGQFRFPNGVAVDGRARVYVADSFNDRVQVWGY